ncbi:hypothetical protein V2E38_10820 [Bifidobacterium longum subsp. infantis]|uniref:hypothetical protein n=1 Tax=Bifidobacterium longum TaxID=216816 RepID=UPI002E992515|nr:hypothetical protein [Bifidobacterium longum subsp. infantis]
MIQTLPQPAVPARRPLEPLNGGTVSRGSIRASSLSHNGTPRRRSHGRRSIATLTMRASYEPSDRGMGSA